MKLFTRSDLERCARRALYLYEHSQQPHSVEDAVDGAVADLAQEMREWVHIDDVRQREVAAYMKGQYDYRDQKCQPPHEHVPGVTGQEAHVDGDDD
jgi:hypothetical protein